MYDEGELDAKSITERDAKINFLAKMIALVDLILQEKTDAKPAKIVAGLEPDKTNAFLQSLFRAATSGIDSRPYIQRLFGGGEDEDDGAAEEEARR